MMFYVYTILVPLIIAMMLWFFVKPKRARKYVNYILLLIVILFFYALILYVLETNSYISEGWMTSATLVFFLIPSLIVILLIKAVMSFKK